MHYGLSLFDLFWVTFQGQKIFRHGLLWHQGVRLLKKMAGVWNANLLSAFLTANVLFLLVIVLPFFILSGCNGLSILSGTNIRLKTCDESGKRLFWLYPRLSMRHKVGSAKKGGIESHNLYMPSLAEQAYIPIEKIIRTSKQSASTSWQCNTSGNHHQPATYGDLSLNRISLR